MTPTPTPNDDPYRAWLLEGLTQLKARRNLSALNSGKHIRQQLHLSEFEAAGLTTMRSCLALHVGRPVSLALTMRVALAGLLRECGRSMDDAAVAARLRSTLLNVRAEKATK